MEDVGAAATSETFVSTRTSTLEIFTTARATKTTTILTATFPTLGLAAGTAVSEIKTCPASRPPSLISMSSPGTTIASIGPTTSAIVTIKVDHITATVSINPVPSTTSTTSRKTSIESTIVTNPMTGNSTICTTIISPFPPTSTITPPVPAIGATNQDSGISRNKPIATTPTSSPAMISDTATMTAPDSPLAKGYEPIHFIACRHAGDQELTWSNQRNRSQLAAKKRKLAEADSNYDSEFGSEIDPYPTFKSNFQPH